MPIPSVQPILVGLLNNNNNKLLPPQANMSSTSHLHAASKQMSKGFFGCVGALSRNSVAQPEFGTTRLIQLSDYCIAVSLTLRNP
jgi:hypothetical protein